MRNAFPLTRLIPAGAFVVCLILTWWVYANGLQGGYLFDDFANLPALGAFGPVDNLPAFWRYITSGIADPSGRPVALLSFLIDGHDWPTDPYPFKRTAILLHLLNGTLLTWLLLILGKTLGRTPLVASSAAVLGAAMWYLHPLFVSTTLYIVQREAMLPATFILCGLLCYCAARESAVRGNRFGPWLSLFSLAAFTVLAALSKANGGLLPLLTLIIEALILTPYRPVEHPATRREFSVVRWLGLILPSLLIFAYVVTLAYGGFTHGMPAIRPWTLGQRLLTESRIVMDYLRLLWWPHAYTAGLFNDAFPISTSVLSPPSTLLSIASLSLLLVLAWATRRAQPALSLAITFFFCGHIIESTVVPLELYFEHRNYVPALMMFWPLALLLCSKIDMRRVSRSGVPSRTMIAIAGTLILAIPITLATLTDLRADLWGNSDDQAILWAQKNPLSPRAQAYAAQIEVARGKAAAAIARLEPALARDPKEIQLALNLVGAKCQVNRLSRVDLDKAAIALRTAPNTGRLGYDWFQRGLAVAKTGSCTGLSLDSLEALLDAAADNPRTEAVPGRVQDRLHLKGRIALLRNEPDDALRLFNSALDADVQPGVALEQSAILARAGYFSLADEHLNHLDLNWNKHLVKPFSMALVHAWVLQRQGYWENEISHMRQSLASDLAPKNAREPAIEQQ